MRRAPQTVAFYRHSALQLGQYMQLQGQEPEVDLVTRQTIAGYREWLRVERGLKPGAEHAALRGLRGMFRWALSEELISVDPTARLRMPPLPRDQPPAMQPEHVEACLRVARQGRHPLRDAAIMLTLYDTGLRRSELIKLTTGDVDMMTGLITVRAENAKARTARSVPVGVKASRAITAYERRERQPAVPHIQQLFLTGHGTALTKDAVTYMLQSVGEKAGLERAQTAPHAWRRGFAVGLLRNGADLFTLQQILGHTTLEMSRRYVKYLPSDLQNAHLRASPADRL